MRREAGLHLIALADIDQLTPRQVRIGSDEKIDARSRRLFSAD